MAIISGSVLFNVTNTAPATGTVNPGIPAALRSTTNGNGLVIKTDISGNFVFNNVPNDTYVLVECYGTATSITSPGNFATAGVIPAPTPADPILTAVPNPPAVANAVQSLSPNTINVTITGGDRTGQNFIDGPVTNTALSILDVTTTGGNLITAAGNGIWGTLPAGTSVNTSPASAPYPGVTPGFTYQQSSALAPNDGNYTVTNITTFTTFGAFFNYADHTTRDETGRFQIVNGSNPGAIVFTQTINILANNYYLLTLWIMNIDNRVALFKPQVGVKLITGGGVTIFNQVLDDIEFSSIPTWIQAGTLFNTGANTSLTLQIYSNGAAGDGNDYTIDDVFIQLASVATIMSSTKTVDKAYADIGDVLSYTIALKNVGQSTITNIVFSDTIPSGTSFNSGTVAINGVPQGLLNPTPPGFTIQTPVSQIPSGGTITVTFKTTVNTIPSPNPLLNSAVTRYNFLPVTGGATIPQSVLSNNAETLVNHVDVAVSKSRDLAFVGLGDIITYTIPITTLGSTSANNVILIDTIPNGTSLVNDSLTLNGQVQSGANPSPPSGFTVGTIPANTVTTVSFKVLVASVPVPNPIPNSANLAYNYNINPTIPTSKSFAKNTNIVTSQFNLATIATTKTVSKTFANVGDSVTYTITMLNAGNVTATNIVLIDTIPSGTSIQLNTFTQDGSSVSSSPNPPGVTLPNSIAPGKISTVTFKVTVLTIPNPNPFVNTASDIFRYTVDPAQLNARSGSSNSNSVNTQVNNANLGNTVKYVDKLYSDCGGTITYTIVVQNSGNVTAQNIVFKDTIPNGTVLLPSSVYINGAMQSGANPSTGVTIPNISPGNIATLTFSVVVTCI